MTTWGPPVTDYQARYPDVAAEYRRLVETADPNSPQWDALGLSSPDGFDAWHYANKGQAEGRTPPTPAAGGVAPPLEIGGLQLGTVAAVAGLAVVGLLIAGRK